MKTEKELDERINSRVAVEVMGWKYQQNAPKGHFCKSVGNDKGWWKNPKYKDWTCAQCCEVPPSYSTNTAHVYEMEERIEELGLKEKYCEALAEILDNDEGSICPAGLFEFIHADPHDKCLAALKAIEEKV